MKQKQEEGAFHPEQHALEAALRGRTARTVRAHLRRMNPVLLTTPRWSAPQSFLEDLALDLAVGEPAVGCRTVSFRPLKGRPAAEAWFFVLQVLGQLTETRWENLRVPSVANRKGFRHAARGMLERAQLMGDLGQVALLAHGAEFLPVELIEDLAVVWAEFADRYVGQRAATVLIAGSVDAPNVRIDAAPTLSLSDFGQDEAELALVGQAGPAPERDLSAAARFSGGVPALVEALGTSAREHGRLPGQASALVRSLGPLADELRGAVHIVSSDPHLAERLEQLRDGEPVVEVPELDRPLTMAGLIKRVRSPGKELVALRAPAIRTVLG
ncbi:MAG: hypothetical protein H6741_05810 [Alphaproteobacteria bacterium]|nr:hypothetical protein [Alphaproteobacteria bacterium]MCB9792223.1 hypothetical protein [Alphaproteobacteria bacterium]